MKLKILSIGALSSSLLFAGLVPIAQAEKNMVEQQISVDALSKQQQQGENVIEKEQLIQRVHKLFPEKFEHVKDENFRVEAPHYMNNEDDVERYRLRFHKEISNDDRLHGSFEFVGKDLMLSDYYFSGNEQDALFPPKVSREEAENIAIQFLNRVTKEGDYKLDSKDERLIIYTNQTLTEPIRYNFRFNKIESGVLVPNEKIHIDVLGNGEVRSYYHQLTHKQKVFDKKEEIMSSREALQLLTEGMDVELRYSIQHINPQEQRAVLTYIPSPSIQGIHAKTGEYYLFDKLVKVLPEKKELKLLGQKPSQPRKSITKEEAKRMIKELLEPENDSVKLVIENVVERENREGKKVYEIQYMYRTEHSGHGSSIEVSKETGELLRFHGGWEDAFDNVEEKESSLSYEQALKKAVAYVKEYAYSHLHEVAYPMVKQSVRSRYEKERGIYSFYFPRVKGDTIVNGNGINITVSKSGKLNSMYSDFTEIKDWPSLATVVPKEVALSDYKAELTNELQYVLYNRYNDEEIERYKLIYTREFAALNEGKFYDAVEGEWRLQPSRYGAGQQPDDVTVEHPWAQKELNFMIDSGIIDVPNLEKFNPDKAVTKGEALEIISKSLSHQYRFNYHREGIPEPTFKNIDKDHDLFGMVETAVENGLLDVESETFPLEESISREELALWYGRILKLDYVANHYDIFKLNVKDAKSVEQEKVGYVAMMNAFEILTPSEDGYFKPDVEVTLAQLAVSNLRLAQKMREMNIDYR